MVILRGGKFTEFDKPRVSLAPSPELCFRAIYPNISKLLEDGSEPWVTLQVYEVVKYNPKTLLTPTELIDNRWVHDANITLEHASLTPVQIKHVGVIEIRNTSDDIGLYYQPYNDTIKPIYHSPKEVIQK